MSTAVQAGQTVTVTESGQRAVIWSAAPGAGRYWAHLLPDYETVLLAIRRPATAALPMVQIIEYVR